MTRKVKFTRFIVKNSVFKSRLIERCGRYSRCLTGKILTYPALSNFSRCFTFFFSRDFPKFCNTCLGCVEQVQFRKYVESVNVVYSQTLSSRNKCKLNLVILFYYAANSKGVNNWLQAD